MRSARLHEAGWGYAFAFVPVAVFGLFFIYPFFYALYISFFHWGILGKTSPGSGTFNYSEVLHDPIYHTALKNIFEFTLGFVPLVMALGLSLALVVNQRSAAATSSVPRTTSPRSPQPSRSRRSSSTSSAPMACSTTCSASARTGSGTPPPFCGGSSA